MPEQKSIRFLSSAQPSCQTSSNPLYTFVAIDHWPLWKPSMIHSILIVYLIMQLYRPTSSFIVRQTLVKSARRRCFSETPASNDRVWVDRWELHSRSEGRRQRSREVTFKKYFYYLYLGLEQDHLTKRRRLMNPWRWWPTTSWVSGQATASTALTPILIVLKHKNGML